MPEAQGFRVPMASFLSLSYVLASILWLFPSKCLTQDTERDPQFHQYVVIPGILKCFTSALGGYVLLGTPPSGYVLLGTGGYGLLGRLRLLGTLEYVCTYVRMYACRHVRMYLCRYVCMYNCTIVRCTWYIVRST